jgi:hypothetical protein
MIKQLGIANFAPAHCPRRNRAANYDVTKANPFPDLPDPLTLKNGPRSPHRGIWKNDARSSKTERKVLDCVPKNVQRHPDSS